MTLNKRVLCVDDEPSIRQILVQSISDWGYEIECSGNVEESIELFDAGEPFLVITDLRLQSHIDGVTLADRLHRKNPLCIFVAISGYVQAFDLGYLLGSVFTDVLAKPYAIEELKGIIDYAWAKRKRWEMYLKNGV